MQAFVDSASHQEVINGAIAIKANYIAQNRLTDVNNPFLNPDPDATIINHSNGSRAISGDEVRTFMAASSLAHSLDGWIYLAHSIESFLMGDKSIAVHLAYYSELRGAMSFLACEGIGVLNHIHCSSDVSGNCARFPLTGNGGPGTHKFVWDALAGYLASLTKPKNEILKIFIYNGKNFEEWLNAIPNSSTIISNEVIKQWIAEWSFDVNQFRTDRNLRNEVSYRPKKLKDNSTIDLTHAIQKLTSFWNVLEPKGSEKFSLLDQFLLKKFFKKIHHYITTELGFSLGYEDMIESAFRNLRLPLSIAQKSFFTSQNDHQLFISANNTANDPVNGIVPISIIARATLMLRLTIGYSSNILSNAGILKTEMDFFFNNIGIDNGFWNQNNKPNNFIELWDDVGESITEIAAWLNGRTEPVTLYELNRELANELILYKQINRAGFWGMNF